MKRLAVRLAVVMVFTTLMSLTIIAGSQRIAHYLAYWTLPEQVREALPAPRLWPLALLSTRRPPATPPGDSPTSTSELGITPEPSLEEPHWRIGRSFESFRDLSWTALMIAMGIAALLAVATAIVLSHKIAGPITKVSLAAAQVAKGDLSARVLLGVRERHSSRETAELTESFNQMAAALQSSERERRAMIADIAHELRTPLMVMQMRLEGLKDGLLPFEPAEVERLLARTELLARLVDDLRTLSLVDAGQLSLQRRDSELVALVQTVMDAFRERAEARQVMLALSVPGPALHATIDRERIAQVLNNLLDNALRASPPGSTVSVRLAESRHGITLEVSDGGPGIAEGDLPHIFDRFTQGKDNKGTSGLGLAIVHALVRLHGGSVTAHNHPGGGATFTVALPQQAYKPPPKATCSETHGLRR